MNSRLKPDDVAPDFSLTDVFGVPVRLRDYRGSRLMLSFYRYSSCPLCNLRVHRLIQQHERFARGGLRMLAVFHSPSDSIRKYVGKQDTPFPIVGDPDKTLYARYGVESSLKAVARAAITRLADAGRAMSTGFLPGSIDGDKALVPADFLIDEAGTVRVAYYGRDIGDHLPLERIESFLCVSSEHPSSALATGLAAQGESL